MRLSRADVLALLIVLGAAITGVVVWNHGTVDLGMTLRVTDGAELGYNPIPEGPIVIVDDVTPGGLADRNGFWPGMRIIGLTRTDGAPVASGEPLDPVTEYCYEPEDSLSCESQEAFPWEPGMEGHVEGPVSGYEVPIEAAPKDLIATAVAGDVDVQTEWVYGYASLERSWLEYSLDQSIWGAVVGLLAAVLVWRFLAHGLAGPIGRQHALVIASAVAVPGLIRPAVEVGTPAGIAAGLLVPAAAALVLGISLARHHPEDSWVQTARAGALVAAALAVVLVVQSLTSQSLSRDLGLAMLTVAAIGVAPAAVAAAAAIGARERASLVTLGLVPGTALILNGRDGPELVLAFSLVALLVGWYVLPFERVAALVGGSLSRVRSTAPATTPITHDSVAVVNEPVVPSAVRDVLTIALFAVVVVYSLGAPNGQFAVAALMLAGLVGVAVRSGFIGVGWSSAAIPLAVAVGLPVATMGLEAFYGSSPGWLLVALGLVGLSVGHVLAGRHSDRSWQPRLLWIAAALVVPLAVIGRDDIGWAFLFIILVPLIPGLPVAFAADHDEPRAISTRLETLVVALTPGVAALALTPMGPVPLVAWFIAIVVWRRFTLAPLLGLAQRTQLQRDLAVAAAETERARLAADLHDDALQQLTMLVRTLDEGGHTKEADEAREVATKLRSVVGDLRLPILDDLGAGAALEWLVERVEPLAGGPVKLERSDETRRPPANVELAVFRVAQEALTNAIKHGKPPIAVHYDVRADGRVTLAVDDAGSGIGDSAAEEAPRQGHFGLANMQQRAEQIGALLDVRRWPAGGTRVALEWRPQ
jgi:signal transduction histidine kinase